MQDKRNYLTVYLENIGLGVIGILLVLFPIIFLGITTDGFVLPKEILLCFGTGLGIFIFAVKSIAEGKVKLRTSPLDLPVFLFTAITFLSAIFSMNRYDALASFVPILFMAFLYFVIVNTAREEKQIIFILGGLVLGASLAAALSTVSFSKIYLLPFPYTHIPFFTTFGSLLDQALYFALILPIPGYFVYNLIKILSSKQRTKAHFRENGTGQKKISGKMIAFTVAFFIILLSLGITVFLLMTKQKPILLPYQFGLQTGFAAISQDNTNVLKSFLLGSGIGTYLIDFTRFKPATYNLNSTIWAFSFFRSSSFILEILATTGLLGIASFLFIGFKMIREKKSFLPLVFAFIAAFLFPFSYSILTLFFVLLALFSVSRILANPNKYGDTELYIVTLKRGLFIARPEGEKIQQNPNERRYSKILPIAFFLSLIVIVGIPLYYTFFFVYSDLIFAKSIVAAEKNNAVNTYNYQLSAIKLYPYRDIYYQSFSQTNIVIANALAASQPKNATPSSQAQQQILGLIQQSINSARSASTIAPYNSTNWSNLSTIYRSLIGFGQNADQFTVLTEQQTIALDPNNPQNYITLGGIYYQLGAYDDAIRQFQIAINLKPDYANAYYNYGHAYEAKGDLPSALNAYTTVKSILQQSNDSQSTQKISDEINSIQKRIKQGQNQSITTTQQVQQPSNQQPLNVNQPSTTLPERNPKIKIPAPSVNQLPSPAPSPSGTTITPNL